jgi:2'-5' RNA ligase
VFVAIPVPEAVRREVADRTAALRAGEPRARWVAPGNLHLTLLFLGDTEPAEVPGIAAEMRAVAGRQRPFLIELGRAGRFGGTRGPGTLWLGLQRGATETAGLSAALADRLEQPATNEGGQSLEREWRPHLTLARRAPAALRRRVDAALAGRPALSWQAEELHLYRSHLGNEAPVYEELARAALG